MVMLREGKSLPETLRSIRLQLETLAMNQRPAARAKTLQLVGHLLVAEGLSREPGQLELVETKAG